MREGRVMKGGRTGGGWVTWGSPLLSPSIERDKAKATTMTKKNMRKKGTSLVTMRDMVMAMGPVPSMPMRK